MTHAHTLFAGDTLRFLRTPSACIWMRLSGDRSRAISGGRAPSSAILSSLESLTLRFRSATHACSCSLRNQDMHRASSPCWLHVRSPRRGQ